LGSLESDIDYTLSNCYYLQNCAADLKGVFQNAIGAETVGSVVENLDTTKALTDSEMKKASSYDQFDFQNIWSIDKEDTYPYPTPAQWIHLTHTYARSSIVTDLCQARKATCQNPATYYYRCDCGFLSFETFEAGSPLEHDVAESIWIYDTANHWHTCRLCATKTEDKAHVWDEEKTEFLVTGNFKYLSLFCSTCSNEIRIDLPYSLQVPGQEAIQTPQLSGIPTTQEVDTTYQTIQTIFFFVMGCVVGGFALYGFYTVKELRRQLQEAKNKPNKQNGRYP
jgi:hypothetical protein